MRAELGKGLKREKASLGISKAIVKHLIGGKIFDLL